MRGLIIAAMVPLAACSIDAGAKGVPATGSGDTRSFAVADFTKVELRGSDNVEVSVGAAFSVRATGPAKLLDRLKIERIGDTLTVGRQTRIGLGWENLGHATIHVTMPRIEGAEIAGSGDLSVDRVTGDRFKGGAAGSGDLKIAAISVKTADFDIAGSGTIAARGTAEMLRVSIAGSGNLEGSGLRAASASASVAGSGNIRAEVDGEASVSVMGSGDVDLGGKARCRTTKMGSGTVRCGG